VNPAAGHAEAQGRLVGAAASGSGKKGRERGEVLTNLVEFQFAKKDEPVYAVRTRALDVGQRHVTCETTGYVVCAAAVSAREEAAQGCCRVEERVQGAVRVCSTAFLQFTFCLWAVFFGSFSFPSFCNTFFFSNFPLCSVHVFCITQ
jgi:hypothetical protein